MWSDLDGNNAVMSAALRHTMAERQRLEQALQWTEHFALLGRLAAGILHEIRSCGTPRGQSGDYPTRQCVKGHAAPPVLSPGDARCLVPAAVTICRHLPKSIVTIWRCGSYSRPPHSPSPSAQSVMLAAMAEGRCAGSALARKMPHVSPASTLHRRPMHVSGPMHGQGGLHAGRKPTCIRRSMIFQNKYVPT